MTDGGWTGGWIRIKVQLHTSDFANVQPDTGDLKKNFSMTTHTQEYSHVDVQLSTTIYKSNKTPESSSIRISAFQYAFPRDAL